MTSRRQSKVYFSEVLICFAVLALGITVLSGWLFHIRAMVEIKAGLVPMVFNTGLGFFLAGISFALVQLPGELARKLYLGIGWFLLVLCGATLLENILDRNFGIDMAFVHAWYDYGNTRPGRMAPNTAIGFIIFAIITLLSNRVTSKKQAIAIVVLTFGLLAVGLTGLVGYFLGQDLLFGWARSARMALHTATGMILCAIGIWLSWSRSSWYASKQYFREDEKIRFVGAAILLVVTITTGLSGFAIQQEAVHKVLEDRLDGELHNRVTLFNTAVDAVTQRTLSAVKLIRLDDAGIALLRDPGSILKQGRLDAYGNRLIANGSIGLALTDVTGKAIKVIGSLSQSAEIVAALDLDKVNTAELRWDKRLILRLRLPMVQEGKLFGSVIIDQAVDSLNAQMFNVDKLGKTGEVAVCIISKDELLCYPGSHHDSPFRIPLRSKNGEPLPIEHAIAGERGHIYTLDYRNQNVIAAYSPLAPGLGIVVKQDTVELYAVIRQALKIGAPFIFLIGVLGTLLLYTQLKPLAAAMLTAETLAKERELEIRTMVGAVGDGILTIDEEGAIRSVNAATCRIFGYETIELIGNSLTILMPSESRHAHTQGMSQYLQGRPAHLVGKPYVEVNGLKKDGTEFPLELTINQVVFSDKRIFVGVMRDITDRKAMQHKLTTLAQYDILTGLPNRALFMDRLITATKRTERSGMAIALMFLDLDGFKNINDTLGHQGGDELLVQLSQRLSAMVRKTDTVARLAGDEFTILLEGFTQPKEEAIAVANKIINSMQSPFTIFGHDVVVTVSLGLVIHEYIPGTQINVADFLHSADEQMYAAKRAGKNRLSIAS